MRTIIIIDERRTRYTLTPVGRGATNPTPTPAPLRCRRCGTRPMLEYFEGSMIPERDGRCDVCVLEPAAVAFRDAATALMDAIDHAGNAHNGEAQDIFAHDYPFAKSFDEVAFDIRQWIDGIGERRSVPPPAHGFAYHQLSHACVCGATFPSALAREDHVAEMRGASS